MSQLVLRNISFYREQVKTISSVSLDVSQGEIVALVGPSGCGKSTLLRLLLGLEAPSQGEIYLEDELLSSPKRQVEINKRQMGVVFQTPSLFPHMTVEKNALFGLHSLPKAEQKERLDSYLKLVGLSGRESQYPHQLSGGEQQRIALIRSLMVQPKILLLDEPFANLDSVIRRGLRSEIVSILKAAKMTAIFVTHDPLEAMEIADRIMVMRDGELVQQGSPREIYMTPQTAFCARFFGEINHVPLDPANENSAMGYIRPEKIMLSKGHPAKGKLKAVVEHVMFAGHDSMVFVKSAGLLESLRVHITDEIDLSVGDEVTLDFDEKNIMIFNEE